MRGFSFYVEDECYAVDVTLVQKVARNMAVTPVPAACDEVVGITNLKGRVITLIHLKTLLNTDKTGASEGKKINETRPFNDYVCRKGMISLNAVVFKPHLNGDENQMALVMDRPGDLIEIPDELSRVPSEKAYIAGVVVTGGSLYRVIDVDSIIQRFFGEAEADAAVMNKKTYDPASHE